MTTDTKLPDDLLQALQSYRDAVQRLEAIDTKAAEIERAASEQLNPMLALADERADAAADAKAFNTADKHMRDAQAKTQATRERADILRNSTPQVAAAAMRARVRANVALQRYWQDELERRIDACVKAGVGDALLSLAEAARASGRAATTAEAIELLGIPRGHVATPGPVPFELRAIDVPTQYQARAHRLFQEAGGNTSKAKAA